MVEEKRDYYGKEVADAIQSACNEFGVTQDQLDIEVIEAGSSGIFGLIRKKAHIRVSLKGESEESREEKFDVDALFQSVGEGRQPGAKKQNQSKGNSKEKIRKEPKKTPAARPVTMHQDRENPVPDRHSRHSTPDSGASGESDRTSQAADGAGRSLPTESVVREELSEESVGIIQDELQTIVTLMGFPATVDVRVEGLSADFRLSGEYEAELIGHNGKVLDSIQYLLRKIAIRKVPEKMRLSVDVGNYRERRLEELKQRALELAAQVKDDGKTQALPPLSPSERREIHLVLQDDQDIRSRSVGDGLFKKVLIYKPGKAGRSGSRRQGRNRARRRNTNGSAKREQ